MPKSKKEKPVQTDIMLKIGSRSDVRLFRNNQGLAVYPDGSRVQYGVCNPGGSDLIGWRSLVITSDMVGRRAAIFLAIETKAYGRKPTDDQTNFIDRVKAAGGLAGVAWSTEDANKIVDG